MQDGFYECAADDGRAVSIYFRYADRPPEFVYVKETGCRWIMAPQRQSVWRPEDFCGLDRLAPAGFNLPA
ncbi:hypothetical protein G9U51_16830 [Calidifontibacter sp. DB0510]|uniref:Uncharacterized protein n=1 Tax=Metallococcus carri TaxID=1656884 RepID=A0A967B240_9MICO|nr:hypothetical protein [Metallococcus carri]NHN57434.1 hypothetical protein [Metallococcus carri]NOP39170.1 hypothetical protein [Calidifontibacter sp. DB2511S]